MMSMKKIWIDHTIQIRVRLIVFKIESSCDKIFTYVGIPSSPIEVLNAYSNIFWKKLIPSHSFTSGSISLFKTTQQMEKMMRNIKKDTRKGIRSITQYIIICTRKPQSSNILMKNSNLTKANTMSEKVSSGINIALSSFSTVVKYCNEMKAINYTKSTKFHPKYVK